MKNILVTVSLIAVLAACDQMNTASNLPVPNTNVSTDTTDPAPTTNDTSDDTEPTSTETDDNSGDTVTGGSGGQCLAVDVLANDGAFIRKGTAGKLSQSGGKDTFTVDGVSHDLTGIPYSIKSC